MERLISSIAGFEAFGYVYDRFLTSTIPKAGFHRLSILNPAHIL
jgi:hypothetical protein